MWGFLRKESLHCQMWIMLSKSKVMILCSLSCLPQNTKIFFVSFVSFKRHLFIYLFGKQSYIERRGEVRSRRVSEWVGKWYLALLVHFPDSYSSQVWAGQKADAMSFTWFSHKDTGAQVLGHLLLLFKGTLAGSSIKSRYPETEICHHMGASTAQLYYNAGLRAALLIL